MKLPDDYFIEKSGKDQIIAEGDSGPRIQPSRIEIRDGVYTYLPNEEYPLKGYFAVENIFAMNAVKALIIEIIKNFRWYVLPFIFRKNKRNVILTSFNHVAWKIVGPFVAQPNYLTDSASSFLYSVYTFLVNLDFDIYQSKQFAMILTHCIHNDRSYYYRVTDMMSELDEEKLWLNPSKELERLCNLYVQREKSERVANNVKRLIRIIRITLLIPKIKRALRKTIEDAHFESMRYDDGDRYWCKKRNDYEYNVSK